MFIDFFERERGRKTVKEGGREREKVRVRDINVKNTDWFPPAYALTVDWTCNPGFMGPDQKPTTFWCYGRML